MVEEGHQGVTGVEIAAPVGKVVAGEENLRYCQAVLVKGLSPGPHQQGLADGGRRLFEGDGRRAAGDAEGALAGRDSAGRDNDNLVAFLSQLRHRVSNLGNLGRFNPLRIGKDAAADLDDDPAHMGK
jgi:hypothetical protein